MYDIIIIGAGVIGASIARELSKYDIRIAVLDKESDACMGASKANSGMIHAGFDPAENTQMAMLNVQGNPMFDSLCEDLDVPFERNGSLVVAFSEVQMDQLEKLKKRGNKNGITGIRILTKEELQRKEPNINPEAIGALYAETAGIIDPMLLTFSMLENAVANGVEYYFDYPVKAIEKKEASWLINSEKYSILSKTIINAAGIYADKIHNMVSDPIFTIKPIRGQYFILDKNEENTVNRAIFPCPTRAGKGILVAPTIHGNIITGPTSEKIADKEDVGTSEEMLSKIRQGARLLVPGIKIGNSIRNFSGLRAEPSTGDFIIGEVQGAPNFINAAGIKSPGLTAAPAIARHIASILMEKEIITEPKSSYEPKLKRKHTLGQDRVICRCEKVTEGDIIDSIRRNPGATTMDGVKFRCQAGMGRCQSGFCGPKVQEILARELNKPLEEIVLNKKGSYILAGRK